MAKSSVIVKMSQEKITEDAFVAIGRIVRACADLEDVLNLWICKLSGLSEAASTAILGRTNISTKKSLALALAKLKGEAFVELHNTAFDDNMSRLLTCRNAVAHGAYTGRTDDGKWSFLTATTVAYENGGLSKQSLAYSTEALAQIANAGTIKIGAMDRLLGLKPWRDKRQWQDLAVHPEDQRKGKIAQ